MKKLLLLGCYLFFLVSCGGGSGGESLTSTETETTVSEPTTPESQYPLHRNIKVTWFYVGEPATEENLFISNVASAWDDIWLWHYGGVDSPSDRNNYYPSKFIPSENPFYVALPYNDLDENGNLKSSARQIPWFSEELLSQNGSVLKNRWVKIIKGNKIAYAQWEDVGPFGEDDFDYVFGDAPPANSINGAGIDVSPAVRDYLGLSDVDYVDWQFVDEKDVPPGPWKDIVTTTPVTWLSFASITPETTWYMQLQGSLRTDIPAQLYEVDLFDTPEETIGSLKESGKIVICYFSAGSFEDWRPDADQFPESAIGNPLDNWTGEWWLDIRDEKVREIMINRIELAKEKGCDGVEPDNVDGFVNDTGFPLTYEDQFNFNRLLAIEAKKRGLIIGLKNDLLQVEDLVVYFDYAMNEECHEFNECDMLSPFVEADKPVFNVEYDEIFINDSNAFEQLCQDARERGFRTNVMPLELDGSFVKSCDYGSY